MTRLTAAAALAGFVAVAAVIAEAVRVFFAEQGSRALGGAE